MQRLLVPSQTGRISALEGTDGSTLQLSEAWKLRTTVHTHVNLQMGRLGERVITLQALEVTLPGIPVVCQQVPPHVGATADDNTAHFAGCGRHTVDTEGGLNV